MSDSSPPSPSGNRLLLRLLALAVLFAALNAWSVRHLGQDLMKLGILNAVAAAFGLFFAFLQEDEQKRLKTRKQKMGRKLVGRFLDPTVLIGVTVVFLLGGSFLTSVTVLADGVPGRRTVHITFEGEARDVDSEKILDGTAAKVRYLRFTTPFGRPFYAEVDGYLRHSFDLYPWTGATLRVGRDLDPAPAVLVRVPVEWFPLLPGGRLRLTVEEKNYDLETAEGRAAAFLGRGAAISRDRLEDWRSALIAAGHSREKIEEAVLTWKNPTMARDFPSLPPGTELEVEFLSRAGKAVTGMSYRVTGESLQDLVLPMRRGEK